MVWETKGSKEKCYLDSYYYIMSKTYKYKPQSKQQQLWIRLKSLEGSTKFVESLGLYRDTKQTRYKDMVEKEIYDTRKALAIETNGKYFGWYQA